MDESAGLSLPAEVLEPTGPCARRGGRFACGLLLRLIICLALAGIADWMFYRQPIGWAAGLMTALTAGTIVAFRPRSLTRRSVQIAFALELGLAIALVIEPLPSTLLGAAAGLVGLALVIRQGFTTSVAAWCQRYVMFAVLGVTQPFRDVATVSRVDARAGPSRAARPLAGWILPMMLGGVFVALFAVANPVIGRWVETAAESIHDLLFGFDEVRVLFWTLIVWVVWALLRTRTRSFDPIARPPALRALLRTSTLVRCLIVFNLLFAVQHALDLQFLFLGAALPDGMTYAEYAHRGAYPLVVTALLAAGFVVLTIRAGVDKEATIWARRLVYLWLLQNVLLTFAAVTRLALYVEAYTLTRLRLAAAIWIALVAVGLILIAVRVLTGRTTRWLVWANTVAVLGVLYVGCFVDTDRFIAEYNVAHSAEVTGESKPLDFQYLGHLGTSALPAWRMLAREARDPEVRSMARDRLDSLRTRLERQLSTWRGWTLRRAHLVEIR